MASWAPLEVALAGLCQRRRERPPRRQWLDPSQDSAAQVGAFSAPASRLPADDAKRAHRWRPGGL